jgi:hypothetical protein
MYPRVDAVLDPTEDWHRLVISTIIYSVVIIVPHRRPKHSPAFLGCDSEVQLGKVGATSIFFFHVIEIKEKGQNTNSLRTQSFGMDAIVVCSIELSLLVVHELEVLRNIAGLPVIYAILSETARAVGNSR